MISKIYSDDEPFTLTFDCGELPVDEAVYSTDYDPNGDFWTAVAVFLDPDLEEKVELDPEGGGFYAYGELEDLENLQKLIEPYLNDSELIKGLIEKAKAVGFDLWGI